MSYLSIDPGVSSGYALWDNGKLVACGAGPDVPPFPNVTGVVIEKPQVYEARHSKGDPNNLITLAIQVGRYVERYASQNIPVALVLPHTWKGNVPKEIHGPRIFGKLSPTEQDLVARGGKGLGVKARGDMVDAVGLGQYAWRMGIF